MVRERSKGRERGSTDARERKIKREREREGVFGKIDIMRAIKRRNRRERKDDAVE